MVHNGRGWFIVLEGPEGSGKSTQVRLLCEGLRERGVKCIMTREPGGTRVAEAIRRIILSPRTRMSAMTELLLYEAARAQHVEEIIRPALQRGYTVVSDRFTDATLVYQGYGRGIEQRTIRTLNQIATGGLRPDFTVFLDVEPTVGLARVARRRRRADRLERESVVFHQKVRQGYRLIARRSGMPIISTDQHDARQTNRAIMELICERLRI